MLKKILTCISKGNNYVHGTSQILNCIFMGNEVSHNDRLCMMLKDFDIMVSHCDYWGISKTVIEASFAKLPTILNKHPVEVPPEYKDDWLVLCDNSPEGYKAAILNLIENESLRIDYGQKAYLYATANFDPNEMERRIVRMYKEVIGIRD